MQKRNLIPRNLILAQFFLGIVIFSGIFILIPAKTAMAQDWLEDFEYRRPVTVTNDTGGTLEDYQVLFTFNTASLITAGKMRSDCGDIRITGSDGTTTRDYWLESGCTSTNAKIWVDMPSIPTGTTTIFAYYGSSTATSISNGSSTFELFFDDFTGTSIDTTTKWVETDGSGYISQDDQLIITNGTGVWGQTGMHSVPSFSRASLIVQAKYKSTCAAGGTYHDTTMLWWKDTDSAIAYGNFIYALYFNKGINSPSSLSMYEDGESKGAVGAFGCNIQYWVRQILKAGGGATTQIRTDGSPWSTLYDSSFSTEASLKVGFTHHSGGNIYIDDFIVRKYTSPEPTTEIGGEIARAVCCRPPISGDHTITSDCSCSFGNGAVGIYGIDSGNLTIEEGATLLVQAGQTFVWTPGYTVFVDGYVFVDKGTPGGQGRKGYLWMVDADSDDYPATTSQYLGNTSEDIPAECSDCRRRNEMSTMTAVDLDEGNDCATDNKIHLCGYEDGSGGCNATTAGWHSGLSVCQECDGSSLDSVNSVIDTQRSGCDGCDYCNGNGSCLSCAWSYDSWGSGDYVRSGNAVYCKPSQNLSKGYQDSSSQQTCSSYIYSTYTGQSYSSVYRHYCQCQ